MNGIQILMYHQVGEFPKMAAHRATFCDHRRFATQMAYLKWGGYKVLCMDEALRCLRGEKPIPSRAVVLTFDDAYENFYEYAFPVLQRHGFPALVYAISSLIGKPASWLAADDLPTPPLMSGSRLRELRSYEIEIGSHSATHVRLADQDMTRIHEEVTRSKIELENILGERVGHFCYPYGSHDMRVVEAVASAGYVSATTCERASASSDDDPLTLPRKAVSWGDSLIGVLWKMHFKNKPKKPSIRRSVDGANGE